MKLEALKELAAKVARGEWDHSPNGVARQVFPYKSASIDDLGLTAVGAFNDSLDAAKALHDAVLPGWDWSILSGIEGELVGVGRPRENFEPQFHGADFNDNPARAWLLAILRALIAQEEGK